MGYGEFGGTGSVTWQVLYDDPHDGNVPTHNPTGKQRRGRGRDKGDGTENGKIMYLRCTHARVVGAGGNTLEIEVTLANKDDQVAVWWGNDRPNAWPTTAPASVQPIADASGTTGPTGRKA